MKILALTITAVIAFATGTAAQTTAFVGARVIDGRGKVIDRGTIIVRDGKIVAGRTRGKHDRAGTAPSASTSPARRSCPG